MTESTRERILNTILERQRCTINDLADAVGINPISVRHHIIKLEAQGLVSSKEERQGVGRPPKVYSLTEAGMEMFPTRYLSLTNRLLDQVKAQFTKDMVSEIFTNMAEDMAEKIAANNDLASLSMEDKLDILKEVLTQEGFTVEWERDEDHFYIHEISCPYYRIGENHPEVCSVDETLISNLLMVPAQRVHCVLTGDSHCTYEIASEVEAGEMESIA